MGDAAMSRIHHVGIVVASLGDAYRFYRDTLGLPLLREAVVRDQGIRAALLGCGDAEIELLEPLDPDSGVARFLAKRGEGLHHLCFETPDIDAALEGLREQHVELIDQVPRSGLAGRIGFLHPRACGGVLVELVTPPEPIHPTPTTVRLKRLVIGAGDVRRVAGVFRDLFGLSEVTMHNGTRAMLAVDRGTLLIVPSGEVGGTEGMVALSLVAEDFGALLVSFNRAGTKCLRGTGEVTLEPAVSHGVHLHISRYE